MDDATIEAEVARLADVGFAGIELQTLLFGMSQADVDADPRVRTVGSAEYLDHVGAFLRAADERQLSTTLTLGSGWPSGGVFSTDVRPRELLYERMDVTGPIDVDIAIPTPSEPSWVAGSNGFFPVTGAFDPEATLLSVQLAPIVDAAATPPVLGVPLDVTASVVAGSLQHGGAEVEDRDRVALAVDAGSQADVAVAGRLGESLEQQRAGHRPADVAAGDVEGQPHGVGVVGPVAEGGHEREVLPAVVGAVQRDVLRDGRGGWGLRHGVPCPRGW